MASVCYVGWWINQVTATFITVCTGAGSEQTGQLYRGNPAPSRAAELRASLLEQTKHGRWRVVWQGTAVTRGTCTLCPVGWCNLYIGTEYREQDAPALSHSKNLWRIEGSMFNRCFMKLCCTWKSVNFCGFNLHYNYFENKHFETCFSPRLSSVKHENIHQWRSMYYWCRDWGTLVVANIASVLSTPSARLSSALN